MTSVTITGMTGHDAGTTGHDQRNTHNQIPDTQMVCVMEREADFFELFDEQR